MNNNRIEIPEEMSLVYSDGEEIGTIYASDTLRMANNMAAEYFNLESNVTIEDLRSSKFLLEMFIDFLKDLYYDLDNLSRYVDIDIANVGDIGMLHDVLELIFNNLSEGVDSLSNDKDDDYEIVSLEEAFEFLLDNGYGEDDTFIDEDLLETERKAHKFITNIIDNVDAIKTVGRRFGVDIYQIEEDYLHDSEFVDILLGAIRTLQNDLFTTDDYEEFIDLEDAVAEVYIGLVTLKSLLNKLTALRHSNI
jgi:hypothetical protein